MVRPDLDRRRHGMPGQVKVRQPLLVAAAEPVPRRIRTLSKRCCRSSRFQATRCRAALPVYRCSKRSAFRSRDLAAAAGRRLLRETIWCRSPLREKP